MSKAMNEPRKGYRTRASIPPDLLAELQAGTCESRSLTEGLAIDFEILLHSVAPSCRAVKFPEKTGVTRRMLLAAQALYENEGIQSFSRWAGHPSDTVRGWAAYLLALSELPLSEQLTLAQPLIADPHFGVREWAWLAFRPQVIALGAASIATLQSLAESPDELERRFAVEILRPRGVWCAHFPLLKNQPELALPILEPSLTAKNRYLQDSLANWLNDAGKSQPDWVITQTKRWRKAHGSNPQYQRMERRALRNLS